MTGAASGIGLAVAEALAAEGMQVVMTDIDAVSLDDHVTRLRDSGAAVHPIVVDVRDPDAVDAAGQAAVERFGVCMSRSTTPASSIAGTRGSSVSTTGVACST